MEDAYWFPVESCSKSPFPEISRSFAQLFWVLRYIQGRTHLLTTWGGNRTPAATESDLLRLTDNSTYLPWPFVGSFSHLREPERTNKAWYTESTRNMPNRVTTQHQCEGCGNVWSMCDNWTLIGAWVGDFSPVQSISMIPLGPIFDQCIPLVLLSSHNLASCSILHLSNLHSW